MVLKFYDFINEVRSDLQFSYLKKLMADLGYQYTNNDPNHKFWKDVKKKDGGIKRLTLTTHRHHTGGTVDPAAFTEMKMILKQEYELSGDKSIFDKVDWSFIGTTNPLKSGMVKVEDEEDYSDYEVVQKMFKNVCVIKNKDDEYNLCKSPEDKRPLLDRWYTFLGPAELLGGKTCLGYDDDAGGDFESDKFGTHKFEIKPDGTLGKTWRVDYVVESVKKP